MMTQENIPYTADEIKAMVKTCEKYNKALDMAKKIYNSEFKPDEAVVLSKYLLLLFPELKENEDEKNIKDLIDELKCSLRSANCQNEACNGGHEKRIALLEWSINWLEKQKPNTRKREIDDAYLQGICDAKHEIEKQGEPPRTDIEIPFGAKDSELQEVSYDIPKGFYAEIKDNRVVIKKTTFKVGNWVVKNGIVVKILDKQKYGFVGLDVDGNDFFCNYGHTDSMRLWNISDAKDGDVLLEEETGEPFIYNGNRAIYFSGYFLGAYCGIYNGEFNQLGNNHHWGKNSYPATKEQRDLLFQKMKEAGYIWDNEKKELKLL